MNNLAPKDDLGREIADLAALNPVMIITDDDRYAAEVYAKIDTDKLEPDDCIYPCRVRTERFTTEAWGYDLAMSGLELMPFAALEIWNGRIWETVWDGAVEYSGVPPE